MSLPQRWSGSAQGGGLGRCRPSIHSQVIVTVGSSMGTLTMELQAEHRLFSSSAGLFTVRDPQNGLSQQSAGVNVEMEATCCMKQLRHYACCWPAPLRGGRVQAADGDLAAELKSTSGTRCGDFFS